MKSFLSSISKTKNLTYISSRNFAQNYAQAVVNKYIITRINQHKFSLYLDPDATVSQFKAKLQEIFPNTNIGITSFIKQNLGNKIDIEKQKEIAQKMKDLALIDVLLLNNIMVYEKNSNNELVVIYGLQISELNTTNRINIPQHIEQGITQLNSQLSTNQLTTANSFSFQNIKPIKVVDPDSDEKILANGLTQRQQQAFQQSVQSLIAVKKFQDQVLPFLPNTKKLMKRIIAMMSINWLFLFYLTYGKYGWDVGEPVSYLTGLGVDLAAITGLFQSNQALTNEKESGKKALEARLNMRANQNMARWRIAYLSRKTIL